jgi:hypothetical protein
MKISEITEESGSALTFQTFTAMGVEPEPFWERAVGTDFYWMPVKEKRQEDPKKPPHDVVVGIKLAFRNKEDAERVRTEILNSGQ